jgi:hypothetical protein
MKMHRKARRRGTAYSHIELLNVFKRARELRSYLRSQQRKDKRDKAPKAAPELPISLKLFRILQY